MVLFDKGLKLEELKCVHDVQVWTNFNVNFKWGLNKSLFDINSVVFHFDDFNYGRKTATIYFEWLKFNSAASSTYIKMNKKTIPDCQKIIVEINKFDITNTYIHNCSFSWLSMPIKIDLARFRDSHISFKE